MEFRNNCMVKKLDLNIDFSSFGQQFQGLEGRHPGLWPSLPRWGLLGLVLFALLGLAYFFYWQGQLEELTAGEAKEETLKAEYKDKIKQAVNLDALKSQKLQVEKFVGQLEKQLPSKAQMDALLSDINQAGIGRGLQFELFKPGSVTVKDYYAELPISIKLVGAYHDLGAFTSDISNLPRIVTLNNMTISGNEKSGVLTLETTAKTFRYLDDAEVNAQRVEAAKKKAATAPAAVPGAPTK
jgi:type IV pilus assembly protein PilO